MVEWLQKWYSGQCDGDWEHEFGISIGNIDNPGWNVEIDLARTKLHGLEMTYLLIEKSDTDWYAFSIEKNVFKAAGDPTKLNTIISVFKEIWDSKP